MGLGDHLTFLGGEQGLDFAATQSQAPRSTKPFSFLLLSHLTLPCAANAQEQGPWVPSQKVTQRRPDSSTGIGDPPPTPRAAKWCSSQMCANCQVSPPPRQSMGSLLCLFEKRFRFFFRIADLTQRRFLKKVYYFHVNTSTCYYVNIPYVFFYFFYYEPPPHQEVSGEDDRELSSHILIL